jgi:hypothetical protein
MFNYKRAGLIIGLSVFFGVVIALGVDTAIMGLRVLETQRVEARKVGEERLAKYDRCIQETYPTLRRNVLAGFEDNRTGIRYNVVGTDADKECFARAFGRER